MEKKQKQITQFTKKKKNYTNWYPEKYSIKKKIKD